MKISIAQMDLVWEDPKANQENLSRLVNENEVGDLLILPELWACGFTMNRHIYDACNDVCKFLSDLSREEGVWIIGGLPEYNEQKKVQENRLVLFNREGDRVGHYAKRKLFTFAGEHKAYGYGDRAVIWDIEGLKVVPLICYELRFPELCREVAKSADLFIFAANWPEMRQSHWDKLLPARAIENQAYVAGVNRIGSDGNDWKYSGHSVLLSPVGETIIDCSDDEGLLVGHIDLAEIQNVRTKLPFLDDAD